MEPWISRQLGVKGGGQDARPLDEDRASIEMGQHPRALPHLDRLGSANENPTKFDPKTVHSQWALERIHLAPVGIALEHSIQKTHPRWRRPLFPAEEDRARAGSKKA